MSTRPAVLVGTTHKVELVPKSGDEIKFYVTINSVDDGMQFRPYEVFVNCMDATYQEHLIAVTVGISRQLQAGVDISKIVRDLKAIHSGMTGHLVPGTGWAASLYARLGMVLEEEYRAGQSPKAKALLELIAKTDPALQQEEAESSE